MEQPAGASLRRAVDCSARRRHSGSVKRMRRSGWNVPQLPCGKALYSYEGKEAGDLKFSKGDIIILRRKVDENWFHGELNGSHGFLPVSYIQCIRPLSQTPPQGKALYDFEVKDKDQDKDCLTFTKDEILTVIRRVDDNWAEGMLGDKIGIFPILYVELNETAKQLMEMDKPSAAPGPSAESPAAVSCNGNAVHRHAEGKKNAKKRHSFTALSVTQRSAQVLGNNRHSMEISAPVLISSSDPRAAARIADCPHLSSSAPATQLNETAKQLMEMDKPSASAEAVSCNGNGAHTHAEGKKNAKKRHSFTALSMTQRSAQVMENNRHSMEISAPVLISSSDPRAAARIADCPHLSSSAPATQDSSITANSGASVPPRVTSTTGELLAAAKVQLPLNIYLAMYAYKPQKADELELRKGEMYRVMEKCQDGWFKGTSLRSGASGVFPGNYVTPISRAPFAVGQTRSCLSGAAQAQAPGSPGSAGPSSPVLLASASASRSSTPLSSPSSPQLHLKNCLRLCSQQTVNQARSAMQLVHSPPASSSSPSRSPARPLSHAASTRPLRPLTSATITPPNTSAAHLNGAEPQLSSTAHTHADAGLNKLEDKKLEKKEKRSSGLLKLLSGAAAKKKSRSPPSVSPTHEPSAHGRAGSCPIESEMQGAMGMEPLHRKTGSLELNFSVSPPARQPCSSSPLAVRPEPKPLSRERYRVVVPYPPQSEAEIELKEGDVVFVHKKREDGWFKGTLQRTGRTGLFPSSFVESF
ncbi:SH3 domain-containing RING finger protein 3-like [Sinocyclocheilus rhinocerous]|uniref:SH3 domain-containing RING finger protein 3-like n=1 Tax=Sinocyclocheilus rhinocerous TaxID=307959 RepID=UPI0007B99BCA|nr:PREDICTED: SH3 domain-containing RING finger protein 3-like [Sinocyclocheilus rhinocerous]